MSDVIQEPIIAEELPPIPVPPVEPEKPKRNAIRFHFDGDHLTRLFEAGEITIGETLLMLGEFSMRDLPDAVSLLAKFVYDTDHFVDYADARRQVMKIPFNQLGDLLRELGKGLAEAAVPPANGRG